jgi:hypothetical protein
MRGKAHLSAWWSKKESDVMFEWKEPANRQDSRLLYLHMATPRPSIVVRGGWMKSLCDELEERGYDLTTLRFSIRKKEKTQ